MGLFYSKMTLFLITILVISADVLNHLKSTISKEPATIQALLADLKNFKEENY